MRITLLLIICTLFGVAHGQNDLLLLRKHNKTIRQFYPDMNIDFYVDGKQLISGQIASIKNDSLYLNQFDVRRGFTEWGSFYYDTITTYHLAFAFKDVIGFPSMARSSSVSLPTLMMVGATGFAALNVINSVTQKEKLGGEKNLQRLGTAAGVFAVGYIWKKIKTKASYWEIGKKYKLLYLSVAKK